MGPFKSDFLRGLSERGFIHQITDAAGLDARAQSSVISAYIGFDATADSLHIGSLVQIMLLRRLQQAGPPSHRSDGRRHHQGRGSIGPR